MNPLRFFFIALLLPLACSRNPAYACDLFSDGRCTIKPGDVYEVLPPTRSIRTWTDFSHHLYFHSTVTPGLRVEKSAQNGTETVCHYRLSDPKKQLKAVEGELEGFRRDDDGIWCFDYFGTQLLKFVRANDLAEDKPDLLLFPLDLELSLVGAEPQTTVTRPIRLHLSGWEL